MRPQVVHIRRRSARPDKPAPLQVVVGPSLDDVIGRIKRVTERLRNTPSTHPAEMAADRVFAANEIDRELARIMA